MRADRARPSLSRQQLAQCADRRVGKRHVHRRRRQRHDRRRRGNATRFPSAARAPTIRSSLAGQTFTITDKRGGSPDGTDTVTNVENFQFSDGTRYRGGQLQPPVPPPNKIVAENMKQGNPISEWGHRRRRRLHQHSRLCHRDKHQCRRNRRFQDRHRFYQLPDRYLPARLLRRRRRTQGGDNSEDSRHRAGAAASDSGYGARAHRLRQLGGLRKLADSRRCGLRRLHRQARPRGRHGSRKPHPVHRA